MAKFVVLLTFGNEEQRLATRSRHREYLKTLFDQGKLLESGPFADETGALLIYEVADEAELREIIAGDPYSENESIARVEIREWNRGLPGP